MFAMVIPR